MARWRGGRRVEVPAWVFDPALQAQADQWLDDLWERDPDAGWAAFVEIISTPTYSEPPYVRPPDG
jgi:hypothetical protein